MKRSSIIILAVVLLLFLLSWLAKGSSFTGAEAHPYIEAFKITMAAFLTLAILSFLYKDNPFYKFAEHLFVGVSAAYWMCQGFWSTIVGNLIPRISEGLAANFGQPYSPIKYDELTYYAYHLPVILGIFLLLRLLPRGGWISRWPLAFIIGTTAGLNFVRYLRSDFIQQVSSTLIPLVVDWHGFGYFFSNFSLSATGQFALMLSNFVIFIGVFCGLVYFYFSKEHTGLFGRASRVGIWILMITFGASFGYTVMGRISLLVGRLTFLFKDWLGLIT